jgi:hypothetical protein
MHFQLAHRYDRDPTFARFQLGDKFASRKMFAQAREMLPQRVPSPAGSCPVSLRCPMS